MNNEVIRSYLLWELSKQDIRELIRSKNISIKDVMKIIKENKSEVDSIICDRKLLVEMDNGVFQRVKLFSKLDWDIKDYQICELGTVLPVCGDLPLEIIIKSLPHVVEYIKYQIMKLEFDNSIEYIYNLMKITDVLRDFPIIVIEPGNIQRNSNVLKKYFKSKYSTKWVIDTTSGFIEDGNHRAIAMVLKSDEKSLTCYVAKMQ